LSAEAFSAKEENLRFLAVITKKSQHLLITQNFKLVLHLLKIEGSFLLDFRKSPQGEECYSEAVRLFYVQSLPISTTYINLFYKK